jgi:hypothetical protein
MNDKIKALNFTISVLIDEELRLESKKGEKGEEEFKFETKLVKIALNEIRQLKREKEEYYKLIEF